MGGRPLRLALFALAAMSSLLILNSHTAAAGQCDQIDIQTIAENRLKANAFGKRSVGIFFAGASINALSASDRQLVEAELDRFFDAFQMVYEPSAYFWGADRDLVRQKQARYDFLVVVDGQLNSGSLPKYNDHLNVHKDEPIKEDRLAIYDYPVTASPGQTPPYAFAQVVDAGPREAYVMFTEFLLLLLGAGLTFQPDDGYFGPLSKYAAGNLHDPAALDSLRRMHEMIVYDCLAPVFRE
jgi:hypothetical protein